MRRREQLSQAYLSMCSVLSTYFLAAEHYEHAEYWARANLDESRCDEEAHQRLMRAYAAQGRRNDALHLTISDSIVDATNFERNALSQPVDSLAYVTATIQRCTIFGHVRVHALQLAENSIFAGRITVACRQQGCIRYCSIVYGSRTPRRFHCQPDLAIQAAQQVRHAQDEHARETYIHHEIDRVRPRFNSVRYGNAAYCQLALKGKFQLARFASDWTTHLQNWKEGDHGYLQAETVDVEQSSKEPCVVPPTSQYRGMENQLYRVEIHKGANPRPRHSNGRGKMAR